MTRLQRPLRKGLSFGVLAVLAAAGIIPASADNHPGSGRHDAPHGEEHVSQINGAPPPGVATLAQESTTILQRADGRGNETIIYRTLRASGTRAPIHVHEYGGTTYVLEGEMTLYMEGAGPARAVAGDCYYMPPDLLMSGVNTGEIEALMYDIFTVPVGKPVGKLLNDDDKRIGTHTRVRTHNQ